MNELLLSWLNISNSNNTAQIIPKSHQGILYATSNTLVLRISH